MVLGSNTKFNLSVCNMQDSIKNSLKCCPAAVACHFQALPSGATKSFLNSFRTDASYRIRDWKSGSRVDSMFSSISIPFTKILRSSDPHGFTKLAAERKHLTAKTEKSLRWLCSWPAPKKRKVIFDSKCPHAWHTAASSSEVPNTCLEEGSSAGSQKIGTTTAACVCFKVHVTCSVTTVWWKRCGNSSLSAVMVWCAIAE